MFISDIPLSLSSYTEDTYFDRIKEPIIPANDVKNAVFNPSRSNGMLSSNTFGLKFINPIVMPKNVPNTPNVETNEGICSIHLRFSCSFSFCLELLISKNAHAVTKMITATKTIVIVVNTPVSIISIINNLHFRHTLSIYRQSAWTLADMRLKLSWIE